MFDYKYKKKKLSIFVSIGIRYVYTLCSGGAMGWLLGIPTGYSDTTSSLDLAFSASHAGPQCLPLQNGWTSLDASTSIPPIPSPFPNFHSSNPMTWPDNRSTRWPASCEWRRVVWCGFWPWWSLDRGSLFAVCCSPILASTTKCLLIEGVLLNVFF
jgi:hypothetical protein